MELFTKVCLPPKAPCNNVIKFANLPVCQCNHIRLSDHKDNAGDSKESQTRSMTWTPTMQKKETTFIMVDNSIMLQCTLFDCFGGRDLIVFHSPFFVIVRMMETQCASFHMQDDSKFIEKHLQNANASTDNTNHCK